MKKIDWNPDSDTSPVPRDRRREKKAAPHKAASSHAWSLEAALRADSRVSMWLVDGLEAKAAQTLVRLQSLPALERMAIMPDVHPSADVCVGCVLGTSGVVYPQAIGGDIGCGMSTVAFAQSEALEAATRREILYQFNRSIDIILRRAGRDLAVPGLVVPDPEALRMPILRKLATGEGVMQLGTLGRGNHFVELQQDEASQLWAMVHSGSRFMGQAVARNYTKAAQREGIKSALLGLSLDVAAGRDYLHDQSWCVAYARANRFVLLAAAAQAITRVLGTRPEWSTALDAPHNFLREEVHSGRTLMVHRKGAAPAHTGFIGLIPGSSGTLSVHVEGRGEPLAMASSSHGAGRIFSRSEAKTLVTERDLHEQMGRVTFDTSRARTLRDEAPAVYRDLRHVMEAQRDLVKVTRTLTPLVSFKAGG